MEILTKPIRLLLFFILSTYALYYSKEVLVPFLIAGLLSMLFLPVSNKLEKKGIGRGPAALICILLLLGLLTGLAFLLSWQLSDLAKDLSGIEQKITGFVNQAKQYINTTFGISPEEQKKMMQKQQSSGGGKLSGILSTVMGSVAGILVNLLLVFVYMFLLLYFRKHISRFILKLSKPEDQPKAKIIMNETSKVARQYLTGLALMIIMLWILYGIGFSIVGVKHAIFFAILCGLLEIVPFIGNITGTALTIIASLAQTGDMNMVLGILVVYAIVQFLQTYIIEPLVVGAEVNINPLFTILVIVVGETIWGIPGMVLAIPLLGIVKIICDHVEPLKPYGFLIGEEKKNKSSGMGEKIKKLFGKAKAKA